MLQRLRLALSLALAASLGACLGLSAWALRLQDPPFLWPAWEQAGFLWAGAGLGLSAFGVGSLAWRLGLGLAWESASVAALAGLCPSYLGILWPKALAINLPYPHDLGYRKLGILLAAQVLLGLGLSLALALRAFVQAGLGRRFGDRSLALRLGGIATVVYLLCGLWVGQWNVSGDAPHYLLLSHSLLYDHDTDLNNDHRLNHAAIFADGFLAKQGPDLADGRHIPNHKVGLPLLLAPGYACLRLSGVRWTLALLAGLSTGLFFLLCLRLGYGRRLAFLGWALLAWTAPWWTHSQLVMPELIGGVLILLAFSSWQGILAPWVSVLSLALLPWMSVRYYPLAGFAALMEAWLRRPEGFRAGRALAAVALSFSLALALNLSQFGSLSPTKAYEHLDSLKDFKTGMDPAQAAAPPPADASPLQSLLQPQLALHHTAGLLIDQEYGWLPYTPVFCLAFLGLVALWRRERRLFWTTLLPSLVYLGPVAVFGGWWSNYAPNRFFVCLTPFFCLWTLECWRAWGPRKGFQVLAALSFGWALIMAVLPWFTYSKQNGANWPLRLLGQALHLDLASFFPSFIVARPLSWAWVAGLIVLWMAALRALGKAQI